MGRGATMQVSPSMAQEGFCNGPMHANADEGPPAVGPGVARAVAQLAGRLAGFEGRHFTDNGDSVLGPPAVGLAPQHKKTSLLGRVHIGVLSPLSGNSLADDTPISGRSSRSRGTVALEDAHNRDIGEQGDPPPGTYASGAWCRHEVHTALVRGARGQVGITEQALGVHLVPGLTEDLPPRLQGGCMPAMDAACARAGRPVMPAGVQRCTAAGALAHFSISMDGEAQPTTNETLVNRIT